MDEKKTKAVSKKELLGIYHCYHSNQKGFHKTPAADNLLWSVCPVSLIVSCQILSKSCNVFVASSYLASVSIHYPPECCTFNYCLIGFSDPVDLWVIKIEKPMILCARRTSKLSEQYRARNADHAARTGGRFVYPIVKQNRKILWLSNTAEIHEVCKGLWDFFSIVLFGWWLAGQTNSGHVVLLHKKSCKMRFPAQCCSDAWWRRLSPSHVILSHPPPSLVDYSDSFCT